ncbi:hypothetical protein ACHAXR_011655 [Thalassiosira sp. AJA248-18]
MAPIIATALLLLPSLLIILTPPTASNRNIAYIFAEATSVQWQGNENVSPEHKAAHDAPRSQKYWDENGIKRPEYAKTDAEIAAERRQKGDVGGDSGYGWIGLILIAVVLLLAITYAVVTGDWDTIMNNPAGAFIANCINWIMEIAGVRGHKLGTSINAAAKGGNAEEARLARLARFDDQNQKNMLDNMKSE